MRIKYKGELYDLVALENLLLSYGTLKHMTNVSYACAKYTFSEIWSFWCFSQSCNSTIKVNVAFIHSIQIRPNLSRFCRNKSYF